MNIHLSSQDLCICMCVCVYVHVCVKKKVRQAVSDQALRDLKEENNKLSRTQNITYDKIETQQYIKRMNPTAAKTIFKCRAKTLNIKDHMRYKFSDSACRWCGIGDETLEHLKQLLYKHCALRWLSE